MEHAFAALQRGWGSTARTRKTLGWWGATGGLIAMQPLMHALQKNKNCQRRALSNSGAERGEKDWGRAGYQRRARTSTGIESKATKIKSNRRKEEGRQRGLRRERAWRVSVGEFMHLTGDYTPALHMSSILSFKSSLQEDRTKHRDNHSQRHKHKIIKEPQTQLQ